jgi:hypothetical protein
MGTGARAAILAVVTLAALAGHPKAADEGQTSGVGLTAADLKGRCERESRDYCLGYLLGFMGGSEIGAAERAGFCLAGHQVTAGDVRTVFLGYTAAHPDQLNLWASDVLRLALRQAYPCGRAAK